MPPHARIAIVQAEVSADLETGMHRTVALSREAAANGATLVAFPETWLPGYPAWLDHSPNAALWNHPPTKAVFARMAAESIDVSGTSGAALGGIAREFSITLVIGVIERVAAGPGRGTLYNALLTYGPDGTLLNHHRKLVPTYTERLVWGPGDAAGVVAVDTPSGRVGGLVCWEHWMPLARQAMHESGEDIHVAMWPTVHEMHQIASRQYAFEGRCFVLAAGSLMRASALPREFESTSQDGDAWLLRGGSAVIAPDGSYLVEPVFDASTILYANLDLATVRQESMTLDVAGHYHRPDCFEFRTIRSARRGP